MPVVVNDNLSVHAPKPIDFRTMVFSGSAAAPYANAAAAIAAIPAGYRHQYLTIWCFAANGDPLEYWWQADTTDASLVPKNKESYTVTADGPITMNPPYIFNKIIVIPTANLTGMKIGLTSGGGELEPGSNVSANVAYSLDFGQYINNATSIYFTNIGSGTKILFYKTF